jgi:hypothetical protein
MIWMDQWEVIIFGIVLDMPIFIKDISQADLIPVAMIWHFTINTYTHTHTHTYIYIYIYIYACGMNYN